MPVRNENRFHISQATATLYAEALAEALLRWPVNADRPSPQQMAALNECSVKLERARRMPRDRYLSLKRVEREALWWVADTMRGALGPDVQPWRDIHRMLWSDGTEPTSRAAMVRELPAVIPEAYALRCLPLTVSGYYDERVVRILRKEGYRRTAAASAGASPFSSLLYRGEKPKVRPNDSPEKAEEIVVALAALAGEAADPAYVRLIRKSDELLVDRDETLEGSRPERSEDRYDPGHPQSEVRECLGHPAGPYDPMGQTAYCDGSCRR